MQAKLRNLLLGAAADAGVSAPGAAIRAGGSSSGSPQAVRALAAAAAASIASVENSPGGRTGARGVLFDSQPGCVTGVRVTNSYGMRRRAVARPACLLCCGTRCFRKRGPNDLGDSCCQLQNNSQHKSTQTCASSLLGVCRRSDLAGRLTFATPPPPLPPLRNPPAGGCRGAAQPPCFMVTGMEGYIF